MLSEEVLYQNTILLTRALLYSFTNTVISECHLLKRGSSTTSQYVSRPLLAMQIFNHSKHPVASKLGRSLK